VKPNTQIYSVKSFLNLVYVATAARLLHEATSAAAERRSISRNAAAKMAARDADEVAGYKLHLWFKSHARHSFTESEDGKILLIRRSGSISAARSKRSSPRIAPNQHSAASFFGTKFGRISSLPATAPYRRGAGA
jgi:hypothetical protein